MSDLVVSTVTAAAPTPPGPSGHGGPRPYLLIVTRRPAVSLTTLPPPSRIAPKASAKIER